MKIKPIKDYLYVETLKGGYKDPSGLEITFKEGGTRGRVLEIGPKATLDVGDGIYFKESQEYKGKFLVKESDVLASW